MWDNNNGRDRPLSDMHIMKRRSKPPRATFFSIPTRIGYMNYPYHGFHFDSSGGTDPFLDPSPWINSALADIDSFRSEVQVPLFLYELKEFPSMLRDLGRVLQGKISAVDVPGGHLAYEFGWAPLVSDLMSLLTLGEECDKRADEIRSIKDEPKLSRTLYSSSELYTYNDGDSKFVGGLTDRIWYTAKARFVTEPPTYDKDGSPLGDNRHLLGLNLRPSQLWNAVPWTWLIDYFIDVGGYMQAWEGVLTTRLDEFCLMSHSKETKWLDSAPSDVIITYKGSYLRESKYRETHDTAVPALRMKPILTQKQMGILSALALAGPLRVARR
jgi:hypothetical protein